MAEYGLRLLHLSDLHLGKAGAGEAWRSRRVLGDAWLEHLDAIRADGGLKILEGREARETTQFILVPPLTSSICKAGPYAAWSSGTAQPA